MQNTLNQNQRERLRQAAGVALEVVIHVIATSQDVTRTIRSRRNDLAFTAKMAYRLIRGPSKQEVQFGYHGM